MCVCVRECGPEASDVTPTRVPKECGYGNFTRRSRTGSVVVCMAPSPARGSLWHKPLTHRVGLATCLAGVGHTPIPSHPPPAQVQVHGATQIGFSCYSNNSAGGILCYHCQVNIHCGQHLRRDAVKGHNLPDNLQPQTEDPKNRKDWSPCSLCPSYPCLCTCKQQPQGLGVCGGWRGPVLASVMVVAIADGRWAALISIAPAASYCFKESTWCCSMSISLSATLRPSTSIAIL